MRSFAELVQMLQGMQARPTADQLRPYQSPHPMMPTRTGNVTSVPGYGGGMTPRYPQPPYITSPFEQPQGTQVNTPGPYTPRPFPGQGGGPPAWSSSPFGQLNPGYHGQGPQALIDLMRRR
jgi:hypothetical protein